jgi:hypothetical protein
MPNPLLEILTLESISSFILIGNLATTGHNKLQGATKDAIIVSDYLYGNNWIYVVLSRVTTRAGLFLRDPISKYKLTTTSIDGRLLQHEKWLRDSIKLR